jgi:hypothetical protein
LAEAAGALENTEFVSRGFMSIISLPNIPEATQLVFADLWIH